MIRLVSFLCALFVLTNLLEAQTQLARTVVASGGGTLVTSGTTSVSLSATIGETVIFRSVKPDNSVLFQGFWLPLDADLVSVDSENGDAFAGEVSNYPNPFSYSTTIRFTVPMDGRITVRMFNLLGDLVRTIFAEVSAAGEQELSLTAVDEYGAPLAAGTYMYEVSGTTSSGNAFRRIARLSILR